MCRLSPTDRRHLSRVPSSHTCACVFACDAAQTAVPSNFVQLMKFWLHYYHSRGRDRRGLETSSRIRFPAWVEVAELLVAETPAKLAGAAGSRNTAYRAAASLAARLQGSS